MLLLRWLVVVGALFAVALFGGASFGDGPLTSASVAGQVVCPNVVLQASLPGALAGEPGGHAGAPEGGHGPGGAIADECLFVVVALAGLAVAGAVRGPLLVYLAYWWARLGARRARTPSAGPMWTGVLRI